MNIKIKYPKNEFIADNYKAAKMKSQILYSGTMIRTGLFSILPLIIFLMGFRLPHSSFNIILETSCLTFFMMLIYYIMTFIPLKRKQRKLIISKTIKYDGINELYFSINDKGFCFREKDAYHEYAWYYFSGYFVLGNLVFFDSKRYNTTFFISQKQLYKEQFEELVEFMKRTLPVVDVSSIHRIY